MTTLFVVALLAVTLLGWRWAGAHPQPGSPTFWPDSARRWRRLSWLWAFNATTGGDAVAATALYGWPIWSVVVLAAVAGASAVEIAFCRHAAWAADAIGEAWSAVHDIERAACWCPCCGHARIFHKDRKCDGCESERNRASSASGEATGQAAAATADPAPATPARPLPEIPPEAR